MTVSTSTRRVAYAGNGVTTVFSVPFPFADPAALLVVLTVAGVDAVLSLAADYNVSGGAGSGTVTMVAAPPVGSTLLIKRETPRTQNADYVPNDPFPAESHEAALDKLTMISQETADELGRAVMVREADRPMGNLLLPPLAEMAGQLVGFSNDRRLIPVSPLVGNPTDTIAIVHESKPLADLLNSDISLDPAEIVSVSANSILDITAINRLVMVSGAASAISLAMPPVNSSNIGDAVFIFVAPTFPGLVTCAGFPASGHLFGGQPNRIMHAGESALLRFDGAGWVKIMGESRPFAGQIEQAAPVASSGTTWVRIPCATVEADLEPSQPWYDAVNFCVRLPRPTIWRFNVLFWFDNITMAAPNYSAPVGTEQGAPVDFGLANVIDASPLPKEFRRTQVHYNQPFEAVDMVWQARMPTSWRVGPVFRCGSAGLTSIRATHGVGPELRTRLSFEEVVEW